MKQLIIQGRTVDFWHAKQVNPWGCMHHALYAATGEEKVLEHIDDLNTVGRVALLWQLGYWEITWYTMLCKQRADADVWRAILERNPKDWLAWIVSIDSLRFDDTVHTVAVAFNLSGCTDLHGVPFAVVSDSGEDDFVQYATFDAFVASPYAAAYDIETLYKMPVPYQPEFVWDVNPSHLKDFDWSSYPPAQAHRPAPSPPGGESS